MSSANTTENETGPAGTIVVESTVAQLCDELSAIRLTPTFILGYISPYLDIEHVATILSGRFPNTPMSLCSTAGELHGQQEQLYCSTGHYWDRVVLHFFDASLIQQAEVVPIPLECDDLRQGKIDIDLDERVRRLEQRIRELQVPMQIDHRDTLAYTVFDGLSRSESFFLEALYDSSRFPCLFVGCSAGGKPDFHKTWIHNGQSLLENHVLVSFLKMAPGVSFGIMRSQNFTPTGTSFSVLSASMEHRYIRQVIDQEGRMVSFIDALCHVFHCHPTELEEQLRDYSFAIRIGGTLFVRSVSRIDVEMDSVNFYCDISPGEELLLVARGDLVRTTTDDFQRFLQGKPGPPIAGILNDCILRRLFNEHQQPGMAKIFQDTVVAGLSTFGETLGLFLNQTLTGIFFFRVPEGVPFHDEYIDNFSIYYGDFKAFFLKRKIAKLEGISRIITNQINKFKKQQYSSRLNSAGMDAAMMSVVEGLNDLGKYLGEAEVQRSMVSSQIEERLRDSEERFRLLSESSVTGTYLIQNNRFTYVNSAFAHMFGYEVDEIINGLSLTQLISPEDRDLVVENIRRRLTGKDQAIRYAFRGQRKNGSTFYLEVHGSRITFKGEVGVIGSCIDITAQKKTEADLRASEENYRVLYNETPSMFFMVNGEGIITAVNDFAANQLGYSKDALVGNRFLNISHEDDRKNVAAEMKFCLGNSGSFVTWQQRRKCKDGSIMWCEEFARSRVDRTGKDAILIVSLDISERKSLEESLKVSQFIFDQAAIGILLIQDDYTIIDANEHACQSLGYAKEELCTLSVRDIDPSSSLEELKSLKFQLRSTQYATFKTVHQRRNGETFPVQVFISNMTYEGRSIKVCFVKDISDMEKARIEQEKLKTQLEQVQKLEAIGRLAGGVAHDLNNLLTPILGYTGLLANNEEIPEPAKEKLTQIGKAADGAKDLVKQLLAFSRKQVLEYKPLDLGQLVEDFSTLLRRTIRENIELIIKESPGNKPIVADQGQIEQVLMNLVVNASDAMPEGGQLTIETQLPEAGTSFIGVHPEITPGRYIILSVSDTGEGMDEETVSKVFEPFFSTKGDLGTGLGLATVYGIVKQHKGHIWVYSEPGMGTVFKIFLPISEQVQKAEKVAERRQPVDRGQETILLVEDNDAVRHAIAAILRENGYTLFEANDGASALKLVSEGIGCTLLLTDVIMPDMNGKQLFESISEQLPSLRVLYMSGYMDDIIVHHGVLEEGIEFIQKPFNAQRILQKVRKVLDS